jgi:hypothetical protein
LSAIRTQVSRGLWRWRAFYELRVIRPEPNQRQPQFGKTTTVSGMI